MMRNKRLMAELSSSKKFIAYNVLFQWIKLLANITIIIFMGKLIEDTLSGTLVINMIETLIICFSMLVVRMLATIGANRMANQSIAKVKLSLRDRLYEKLLSLGNRYQQHMGTSEITQIAGEGVEQLETYVGKYMPQLYYSLLAPLTLFIVIAQFHLATALVLMLAVPFIPFSIIAFNKIAKRVMRKYWGSYTKLGDDFLDNLQGLTTLKIFSADALKHVKMNENAELFRKATMRLLTMQLNSIVIMNVIAFGGASLSIVMAVNAYASGQIELYQGFAIIMLGAEFFIPLRLLGSYFHVAMNGTTACEKLFNILDLEKPTSGVDGFEGVTPHNDIVFNNVCFSYMEEAPLLSDFNMVIPSKGLTAIVGQSGCGKSTIAALLMGYQMQTAGTISIGGIDTGAFQTEYLMRKVTLITHNSFIFKGSVKDNLRMGNNGATDDELWEALEKVKLSAFVHAQGGLNYTLTEQGNNLSGGQKQRLALARALLLNSDVYIFDEATSNIDCESEKVIMALMYELAKSKNVLLISHRLSNVIAAKMIYVFEKPGTYLAGSHAQLMEHSLTYHKLYHQQIELEQYGRSDDSLAS